MPKPTIYVETTVISYFASRPNRDIVIAGHQAVTTQWWEADLPKFAPAISQVVLDEIAAGDSDAAAKRLSLVVGWDVLGLTPQVESLAIEYFEAINLPQTARADALHLALAAAHGMDYLTSWNCQHITSARVRQIVQDINQHRGLVSPVICTRRSYWSSNDVNRSHCRRSPRSPP